jgi:hypothetical protein
LSIQKFIVFFLSAVLPFILIFFFSNETVKVMFTGFMACVRIYSLKDKNDCSEEDITNIVKSDRYHLGLIRQGEDITTCLSGKICFCLILIAGAYIN